MVGGGGQIVSINSTNHHASLLKATGIFEGTAYVKKLVKRGITIDHVRLWDKEEIQRQVRMMQKTPLKPKKLELIYSRLEKWKSEEAQVLSMDLEARFHGGHQSIKDSIQDIDDYAEEMNFNMDNVRKSVEMGEKEGLKKKIFAMNNMSVDISTITKGTKLGEGVKKEQEAKFRAEQEKAKENQTGHTVDKKVQEEWIKETELMQKTAFKDSEKTVVIEADQVVNEFREKSKGGLENEKIELEKSTDSEVKSNSEFKSEPKSEPKSKRKSKLKMFY